MRAAVALGATAALAASGCGGAETPRPAAPKPAPEARAPTRLPAASSSVAARAHAAAAQRRALARARRTATGIAERAAARHDRKDRRATARRVASAIAGALGFEGATAAAPAGAGRVDLRLADADGCRATAADGRAIARSVRAALPYVRAVRVSAGADTTALPTTPPASCQTGGAAPPKAKGKVLFSHRGRGLFTSRQIRIPARPWRLEYSGQGDFLQILVTRADRLAARPIELRSKLTGARTIDVRGPVKLRVAGTGPWTVRVRAIPR